MSKLYTQQAVNCPTCGKLLDAATPIEGRAKPEEGDITLCAYCGEVLVFEAGPGLRFAEVDDLMAVKEETRGIIGRAQVLIRGRAQEGRPA